MENRLGSASTTTVPAGITVVARTYTKADGTTSMAAPGEIGGTVTLTTSFQGLDLNFPFIPTPDDGVVTRSATARIEDVTSSPGGCT